ncbi:MAG: phospholipase D-like domain-containing protein [Pseudomonadota bacterium]
MAVSSRTPRHRRTARWIARFGLAGILLVWMATLWWHTAKPLPDGLRIDGAEWPLPTEDLRFLSDVTAADAFGQPVITQQIFDATLALIAESRDLLVLDYFLFNEQGGPRAELTYGRSLRPLAGELRAALLARHRADPAMPMLLIVDPINSYYAGHLAPELAELRDAGISVATVNLDPLRDSNALYSAVWRTLFKWWLQPADEGMLPNWLDAGGQPMSLGALARLLNFKASHRKVVITGDGKGSLRGIVSSANPHDASSAHSNVALYLEGPALAPLLASELKVAGLAGWRGNIIVPQSPPTVEQEASASVSRVSVVTEGAIRDRLLERLAAAHAGDHVDLALFYLTDRQVVRGLLEAARRGAQLRVILDPNKDAFGFEKSGLPNRQVASELVAASDGAIKIRWYRTHGEQFHTKLASICGSERCWLTLGSANFTRRNLQDFNLEANVNVDTPRSGPLAGQVTQWFDMLWNNRAASGIEFTADLDVYADPSQGRYWLYRFMEASGMSTF